jgi:uncharacterized protein (DUF2384 family)
MADKYPVGNTGFWGAVFLVKSEKNFWAVFVPAALKQRRKTALRFSKKNVRRIH